MLKATRILSIETLQYVYLGLYVGGLVVERDKIFSSNRDSNKFVVYLNLEMKRVC